MNLTKADELNAAFGLANEHFSRRGFMACASIEISGNVRICWSKLEGKWAIRILYPDNPALVPIEKSALKVRIEAALCLHQLWAECEKARGGLDEALENAHDKLCAFLDRVDSEMNDEATS